MSDVNDPFNLKRFTDAQQPVYSQVLHELKNGRKESHWMWFIFPQLKGLGSSLTAQFYAISGLEEARAYLEHPLLGARLKECSRLVLTINGRSAQEIMGFPDDLKLCSCMTLFACLEDAPAVFREVIDKYYGGNMDEKTLEFLGY